MVVYVLDSWRGLFPSDYMYVRLDNQAGQETSRFG